MKRYFIFLILITVNLLPVHGICDEKVKIKVEGFLPGFGNTVSLLSFDFMKQHPDVEIVPFTTLMIEGGLGSDSAKLMAFAGEMAPDVIHMNFHQLHIYVEQGFLSSLNEYIGEDKDGNGLIDDDEAIWDEWKTIDPVYRKVMTVDGKVYGLPFGDYNLGLLYRVDLFRNAGLDPSKPPRTWDELFYCLQKLTNPKLEITGARFTQGRWGFGINPSASAAWEIQPWFWASGGDLVRAGKKNPRTEKTYWYPQEEMEFIDPDTGESLVSQPTLWKANFASPEGLEAWDFLYKMRWQPWLKHPITGEPINLTKEDVKVGKVKDPRTGDEIIFEPKDVIEGVCRIVYGDVDTYELFSKGEVGVIFGGLGGYLGNISLNSEYTSFMPFPAGPNGKPAIFRTPNFKGFNNSLKGDKNKIKRDLAWQLLVDICMKKGRIKETRLTAESGGAKFLFPNDLIESGIPEYIEEIPMHWRKGYDEVLKYGRTEPYFGHWEPINISLMGQQVLSLMMGDKDFDYRKAAIKAEEEANVMILGKRPQQEMAKYRKVGRVIFTGILLVFVFIGLKLYQSARERIKGTGSNGLVRERRSEVSSRIIPWLMLAPALVLIAVWAYYPLMRGAMMAFQDYRIVGEGMWVGLDNFINIIVGGKFWLYLIQTLKFCFLTLGLGFFIPIILAILLSEVPRLKYLYRTLYYLPQVASGLVIMFLWKLMYNPTEYGLLNQLLSLFGIGKHDWLGNPSTAMVCVIIPSIWAGAGAGGLIYLAALKTIPEDLYESAEIEGAGFFRKIWHVTLPNLKPLIIMNFIGAFIGTFYNMENILVMTGGGPGEETMVLSLAIWYRAFVYLQFGIATAMAWILGTMLIGFTLWQLRVLQKVEFRRAE